jgi:hypothetical protein
MKLGLVIARNKTRTAAVRLTEILPFSEANRRFEEARNSPLPAKASRSSCTVLVLLDLGRGEARSKRMRGEKPEAPAPEPAQTQLLPAA